VGGGVGVERGPAPVRQPGLSRPQPGPDLTWPAGGGTSGE